MKLKLTFHGPNTVGIVTREEPIKVGHAISFVTETIGDVSLRDAKRFWDMERTFNELTQGRLHVELED